MRPHKLYNTVYFRYGKNLSSKKNRIVAIHEAGHALAVHLLGYKIKFVSIFRNDNSLGRAASFAPGDLPFSSTTVKDGIAISVASRAAEELFAGDVFDGHSSDSKSAFYWAEEYGQLCHCHFVLSIGLF